MILLGLGANLPSIAGTPAQTLHAACAALAARGLVLNSLSPLYRTAPVPESSQPWFVNAVAKIAGDFTPHALLDLLLKTERAFGRVRGDGEAPNAPRTLDLDLLDYRGKIFSDTRLTLPHPRLHARAFVLHPLRDVAPHWRHPVSGSSVHALIDALAAGQAIARV